MLQSIQSAPKDGTVMYICNEVTREAHLMSWNIKTQRWEGKVFTMAGSRRTYWDKSNEIQPTHFIALH